MTEIFLAVASILMVKAATNHGRTIYSVDFAYFMLWQSGILISVLSTYILFRLGVKLGTDQSNILAMFKMFIALSSLASSVYAVRLLKQSLNWTE